jgi:CBS domain-containing protein
MTREVKTVGINSDVKEAVQKMNRFNIGSVVIMDIKRRTPLGILTERDILKLIESYPEPLIKKIKDVMSHPLVILDPNSNIEEAARLMSKKGIKRLVIMENNKLVGIITSSDIMRASPTLVKTLSSILKR